MSLNNPKYSIVLYSTTGCHLCDEALEILNELKRLLQVKGEVWHLNIIDIAEDAALFERYGNRIPVLACQGKDRELNWPFDVQSAKNYIQSSVKGRMVLTR